MSEREFEILLRPYGCVAQIHMRWTWEEIQALPCCPMFEDELDML